MFLYLSEKDPLAETYSHVSRGTIMKYDNVKLVKYQFLVIVSSLLFTACSSIYNDNKPSKTEKDAAYACLNDVIQEMNAEKNPKNHINDIRRYALENFNNLTEKEIKLIQDSAPKIYENNDSLEYCFAWILPDNQGCLEVIATPPPNCIPFATFRRDSVYFP